jgi:membrane protease subunit (stomatin/prohibitin family)
MHHHHMHGGFGGFGFPGFGGFGMGGGLLGDLLAGGVGYFIGSRMGAQQNQQYQAPYPQYQQYQQYPQQPTASPSSNALAQLKLLGQLRESGILTEEEFQLQKQRILNGF